jgi:hypothetical protein
MWILDERGHVPQTRRVHGCVEAAHTQQARADRHEAVARRSSFDGCGAQTREQDRDHKNRDTSTERRAQGMQRPPRDDQRREAVMLRVALDEQRQTPLDELEDVEPPLPPPMFGQFGVL